MAKEKNSLSIREKIETTLYNLKSIPIDDLSLSKPNETARTSSFNEKRKTYTKRIRRTNSRKRHYTCPSLLEIPIDDLALSSSVHFKAKKTKSKDFLLHRNSNSKQKRKAIEELEKEEDDLYESKSFEKFKQLLMHTPFTDKPYQMITPKLEFEVTPCLRHKTPKFARCFLQNADAVSRKIAMYRRHQKKKKAAAKITSVNTDNINKQKSFDEAIEEACRIQKAIEDITEESDSDDSYFSLDS